MSEAELYGAIMGALSHGPTRLLRINAGMAYQGRVIERTPHRLILAALVSAEACCEGVSDLLGWTMIEEFRYTIYQARNLHRHRMQGRQEKTYARTGSILGSCQASWRPRGRCAQRRGCGENNSRRRLNST